MTPDDELEELERKYQALEGDRRSFFETSRWTIKQNRDTLATAKVGATASLCSIWLVTSCCA